MGQSSDSSKLLSIKNGFLKSKRRELHHCEYNLILRTLSESTLKWVQEHSEDEYKLDVKLDDLGGFLDDVQIAMSSKFSDLNYKNEHVLSEDDKKKRDRLEMVLWEKVEPRWIFDNGYESLGYRQVDRESLNSLIGKYFSSPWLRDNRLEYLFVLALVFQELVEFGEHIKRQMVEEGALVRLNDRLRGKMNVYEQAKGNLARIQSMLATKALKKMLLIKLPMLMIKWLVVIFLVVLVPMFILDSSLHGFYILGLFILAATRSVLAHRNKTSEADDVHIRSAKIYEAMNSVWLALQGAVINPSFLREQLNKSADLGACWDNSVYAMVDVWIGRNAQMFVVNTSTAVD